MRQLPVLLLLLSCCFWVAHAARVGLRARKFYEQKELEPGVADEKMKEILAAAKELFAEQEKKNQMRAEQELADVLDSDEELPSADDLRDQLASANEDVDKLEEGLGISDSDDEDWPPGDDPTNARPDEEIPASAIEPEDAQDDKTGTTPDEESPGAGAASEAPASFDKRAGGAQLSAAASWDARQRQEEPTEEEREEVNDALTKAVEENLRQAAAAAASSGADEGQRGWQAMVWARAAYERESPERMARMAACGEEAHQSTQWEQLCRMEKQLEDRKRTIGVEE